MAYDLATLGFKVVTSGLTKGEVALKDMAKQGAKTEAELTSGMGKIGSAISLVGSAALSAASGVAALGAGLLAMQISSANSTRELGFLSKQAKLSMSDFEALSFATTQYGVSGEQIADISKDISDKLGEYSAAGTGAFQDFADVMSLTTAEAVATSREFSTMSGDQVLGEMVSRMEEAGATANQMTFVLESMGNDASRLTDLFSNQSSALGLLTSRYNDATGSLRLTSGEVADLQKTATDFNLAMEVMSKSGAQISASLAPALSEFFNGVISVVPDATQTIINFINSFRSAESIKSVDALNEQILDSKVKVSELRQEQLELNNAIDDYGIVGDSARVRMAQTNVEIKEQESRISDLIEQKEKLTKQEEEEAERLKGGTISAGSGVTSVITSTLTTQVEPTSNKGLQDAIDDIASQTTIGQVAELNNQLALTQELLDMGLLDDDIASQRISDLKGEIEDLNKEEPGERLTSQFDQATDAISSSLSAMRDLTEQGTSGYYKLSTAMAAVEAAQAAMAIAAAATTATITGGISAAVSLISAISTLGGDLDTTFEATQAVQGLDEWGEKADSISSSVEDTADNTEDLIGINTDMLDALVNLQSDLLSASGIAQQDISSTSIATDTSTGQLFSNLSDAWSDSWMTAIIGGLTFGSSSFVLSLTGWIFDGLDSLLGGSSKTSDTGIQIIGGTIADMIDGASVYAYEEVKSKKYAWSSTKTSTYTSFLDDASTQFSLVFASLADSVYESGLALGFTSEYLTDAINDFVIDTSKISLEDLSTDEITDEIESYFSNVFSDLAESVVYYLSDFQDTGEELSETLTRISTEVSLLNYVSDTLGVSLGSLVNDSESLVYAADTISDLVGGTDAFSESISSFISAFATDEQLLQIYSDSLTESFNDVGLTLPTTSSGLMDLVSSLDASSEAGIEQIATILSLTDVSSEYYDLLSEAQEEMADLSDTFAGAVADIYEVSDATNQMSLSAALAAAQLGDFSLAEALDTSDYELDTADFSSLAEYNVAQAEAANMLMALAELSAAEAGDVETEQLDELKAINQSIINSITETNALLKSQNRIAIDTTDYLDQINNKTSYAA